MDQVEYFLGYYPTKEIAKQVEEDFWFDVDKGLIDFNPSPNYKP